MSPRSVQHSCSCSLKHRCWCVWGVYSSLKMRHVWGNGQTQQPLGITEKGESLLLSQPSPGLTDTPLCPVALQRTPCLPPQKGTVRGEYGNEVTREKVVHPAVTEDCGQDAAAELCSPPEGNHCFLASPALSSSFGFRQQISTVGLSITTGLRGQPLRSVPSSTGRKHAPVISATIPAKSDQESWERGRTVKACRPNSLCSHKSLKFSACQ